MLPIHASLCRSSWMTAEVSIGNGLARPELYISSMSCRVKRISPPVYRAYSKDLIRMSTHNLTNPSSLIGGVVADYIALSKKNGHLESYIALITSEEEGCLTQKVERPIFTSRKCGFNKDISPKCQKQFRFRNSSNLHV